MALDLSVEKLLEMRGKAVFDGEGEKIGSIEDVYIDDETREPEWLGIGTGFLGMKHAIVPLVGASVRDEGIVVPYPKGKVKDAPDADGDDISAEKESELARYYELGTTQRPLQASPGTTVPSGERTTTRPPPTDRDVTMTRTEEDLHVEKRDVPAGQVTLHKYVETEAVAKDAEVKRETARVERQQVNRPVRPGDEPPENG